MSANADRIRRVLSDGAAPSARPIRTPRLREVVEEPPGRLHPDLRRRLEALGVTQGPPASWPARRPAPDEVPALPADGRRLQPPATAEGFTPLTASPHAMWTGEPQSLESLVGATCRETPRGRFLQLDRRVPLSAVHGRIPLRDALAHVVPLRPRERGPRVETELAPTEAAFIDTETSGLSGGTGTVAFLVGAGWIDGDHFLVRQYFMRDYPEEGALLHALGEDLGDRPLVSFNGRSFDWPLLTTRWRLNRQHPPARAHLDLLPTARRLWGRTLHSHSLATLERHVLGLERGEDLPGYLIPSAWFEFLRTGHGGTLAHAFRHNEIDVVSMLALFARVGAVLQDPAAGLAPPQDRLGTALLLLDLKEPVRAQACLEAGIDASPPEEAGPMRRLLGHLLRRGRDWTAALAQWEALANGPLFDAEAHEQMAKILEHRLRDFGGAMAWTRRALDRTPAGSRLQAAFEHRAARLERRLARPRRPRG